MFAELWSDVRYRVRALLHRTNVERELSDFSSQRCTAVS